ncbi:DUF805 domain-containing protein [Leuconostoc citreum]|uniref:DUF805 domain-containing protein n=1 Tax=Leuconostoc citreum TaxID=33964 RepID=UPI0021A3AE65|nr:DUF805 domain-containing protein [Leuconostoc citreum]MCT3058795.1 DUF805 domain-containing protein [Leuconostoc citreum]MDM7641339.1 DUF805 domain-containing protein [Leuconostoc citreum]MDY5161923.1 DUF805 domain-containing protein [Leuconostoc citreum]MDY5165468.1 DUF805 domain-containing protein [Leuconostoc citreum]
MTAWAALVDFFKRYATFRGTSSPRAFNWVTWFWGVIYLCLMCVVVMVAGLGTFFGKRGNVATESSPLMGTVSFLIVVSAIIAVIVFIPNIALYTRRLHDAGFSGWWQLIPMGCYVAFAALVIIFHIDKASSSYNLIRWIPVSVSIIFSLWLTFAKTKFNSPYI